MSVSTTISNTQYPLFVIYSRWSIDSIREFLYDYGRGADGIGEMHVDRDRSGNETDRTICLLDETIYEDLVNQGYEKVFTPHRRGDAPKNFAISRYRFTPGHHPNPGHTYNFFLPLPNRDPDHGSAFVGMKAQDFEKQIQTKINHLIEFGILPEEGATIKIPLASRSTGEPQGVAYIVFSKNVSRDAIVAARTFIDNSLWYPTGANGAGSGTNNTGSGTNNALFVPEPVKCFWAREITKGKPMPPTNVHQPIRSWKKSNNAFTVTAMNMVPNHLGEMPDGEAI